MVLYGFWRGDRPNTIRLPIGSAWYSYERPKPNRKSTIWPACVLGVLVALAWRLILIDDTGAPPKGQGEYWTLSSRRKEGKVRNLDASGHKGLADYDVNLV